jgi:hypothetical protein
MKWKCMHSLNYQLIPEPEEEISEDPVNVTRDLTESPNPGSESFSVDISNPNPTNEGMPWT